MFNALQSKKNYSLNALQYINAEFIILFIMGILNQQIIIFIYINQYAYSH